MMRHELGVFLEIRRSGCTPVAIVTNKSHEFVPWVHMKVRAEFHDADEDPAVDPAQLLLLGDVLVHPAVEAIFLCKRGARAVRVSGEVLFAVRFEVHNASAKNNCNPSAGGEHNDPEIKSKNLLVHGSTSSGKGDFFASCSCSEYRKRFIPRIGPSTSTKHRTRLPVEGRIQLGSTSEETQIE